MCVCVYMYKYVCEEREKVRANKKKRGIVKSNIIVSKYKTIIHKWKNVARNEFWGFQGLGVVHIAKNIKNDASISAIWKNHLMIDFK